MTHILTGGDIAALALLVLCWFGTGRIIEHPPAARPSVSVLMKRHRREWMLHFLSRDSRIFDGAILASLREGISFYASACLIAIGGGLALVGNTAPLAGLARDLDAGDVPALLWQVKLLVILIFVANAFLKLVWAHRLFGYCAIMMAAVPNDGTDARARKAALAAAEVNIHAARNFNVALRAVYFSMAATGWLLGPPGLVAATLLVTGMTLRREFSSRSRRAILASLDDAD